MKKQSKKQTSKKTEARRLEEIYPVGTQVMVNNRLCEVTGYDDRDGLGMLSVKDEKGQEAWWFARDCDRYMPAPEEETLPVVEIAEKAIETAQAPAPTVEEPMVEILVDTVPEAAQKRRKSALDYAREYLEKEGRGTAKDILGYALEYGWKTGGATPDLTIYGALHRDAHGPSPRFKPSKYLKGAWMLADADEDAVLKAIRRKVDDIEAVLDYAVKYLEKEGRAADWDILDHALEQGLQPSMTLTWKDIRKALHEDACGAHPRFKKSKYRKSIWMLADADEDATEAAEAAEAATEA